MGCITTPVSHDIIHSFDSKIVATLQNESADVILYYYYVTDYFSS